MVVTSIIWGAVPGNQFANRWVIPKSSGNGKSLPPRDRVGVTVWVTCGFSPVVRKVVRKVPGS